MQDLATVWHERREAIHTLVDRAEELGRRLAQRPSPFVLCHADIHTNNVLLDAEGQIWIVDWDDTVLAPKERDLMFVVGGGLSRAMVGHREEELFLQGYGATPLDHLALTYYRYARAVSDLSYNCDQVVLRPDLSLAIRRSAVGRVLTMFQPDRIIALARALDEGAS
jgi:spectinomycin phosphotransferase